MTRRSGRASGCCWAGRVIRCWRFRRETPPGPGLCPGGGHGTNRPPKLARAPTRLWPIAAGLMLILLGSVFVFQSALHLRWVDAIYFVVTTATTTGYGDISLKDGPDWLKLFGCLVMLAGGALLGILFSVACRAGDSGAAG